MNSWSPFRDRDSECFGPVQQLATKVEGRIAEIMRNAVGKETCSDMLVQFTQYDQGAKLSKMLRNPIRSYTATHQVV